MRRARWRLRQRMGLELGLALGDFAVEIDARFGVVLGAGEGNDVDRAAELAVTAAV